MLHYHQAHRIITATQAPSALLDLETALEQVCELIVDAGLAGARWIVFSEGFIPGYPAWVWSIPSCGEPVLDDLRAEVRASAVVVPSDLTDRLCRVAQRAEVNVVIGLIEVDDLAGGAISYDTLLFIDMRGQIVGKCRAPLSNRAGQLVWAPSQGDVPANEEPATSSGRGI